MRFSTSARSDQTKCSCSPVCCYSSFLKICGMVWWRWGKTGPFRTVDAWHLSPCSMLENCSNPLRYNLIPSILLLQQTSLSSLRQSHGCVPNQAPSSRLWISSACTYSAIINQCHVHPTPSWCWPEPHFPTSVARVHGVQRPAYFCDMATSKGKAWLASIVYACTFEGRAPQH
jgi:hypothetical protein